MGISQPISSKNLAIVLACSKCSFEVLGLLYTQIKTKPALAVSPKLNPHILQRFLSWYPATGTSLPPRFLPLPREFLLTKRSTSPLPSLLISEEFRSWTTSAWSNHPFFTAVMFIESCPKPKAQTSLPIKLKSCLKTELLVQVCPDQITL